MLGTTAVAATTAPDLVEIAEAEDKLNALGEKFPELLLKTSSIYLGYTKYKITAEARTSLIKNGVGEKTVDGWSSSTAVKSAAIVQKANSALPADITVEQINSLYKKLPFEEARKVRETLKDFKKLESWEKTISWGHKLNTVRELAQERAYTKLKFELGIAAVESFPDLWKIANK